LQVQEIRPYSLVQKQIRTQDLEVDEAPDQGSSFRRYLGEELAVPEDREAPGVPETAEGGGEGVDLEYVAAELACRRNLLVPEADAGSQEAPVQTAHFLRQQRRSVSSPLQAGRLGGVVKAALQSRISIPPPGAMPPPRSGE
jgi:hypothetical protein